MRIVELMQVPSSQHDLVWLKEALQAAIELELATLPPYLCAMWSIKAGEGEVYDLIQDIVRHRSTTRPGWLGSNLRRQGRPGGAAGAKTPAQTTARAGR